MSHLIRSVTYIIFATIGILGITGCGGAGLVSVSGKVTNGDKVLTNGTVTFHPDAEKGNDSKEIPIGKIGSDGSYKLFTRDAEGAAPGWYKITVAAQAPKAKNADPYAQPIFIVRQEYLSAQSTPLSREVKEGAEPADYDLKLKAR